MIKIKRLGAFGNNKGLDTTFKDLTVFNFVLRPKDENTRFPEFSRSGVYSFIFKPKTTQYRALLKTNPFKVKLESVRPPEDL